MSAPAASLTHTVLFFKAILSGWDLFCSTQPDLLSQSFSQHNRWPCLVLPSPSHYRQIVVNLKSGCDVCLFSVQTMQTGQSETGLSTSAFPASPAESYKRVSHVCVCFYGVCVGLAKQEKCSKGQKGFQCQRTDPRGSMRARDQANQASAVSL